jgi:hypothetical protein
VNVGELLRERDRLLGVIEEAKTAKSRLKQINVLIAMYGDASNIELVTGNGKSPLAPELFCEQCDAGPFVGSRGLSTHVRTMHEGGKTNRSKEKVTCEQCGAGPFKGKAGLTMHNQRVHLGTVQTHGEKAKVGAAKKAAK